MRALLLTVALVATLSSLARADLMSSAAQTRSVYSYANYWDGEQLHETSALIEAPDFGVFDESVLSTSGGGWGSGEASQHSEILPDSVVATGAAHANGDHAVVTDGDGEGRSYFSLEFTTSGAYFGHREQPVRDREHLDRGS